MNEIKRSRVRSPDRAKKQYLFYKYDRDAFVKTSPKMYVCGITVSRGTTARGTTARGTTARGILKTDISWNATSWNVVVVERQVVERQLVERPSRGTPISWNLALKLCRKTASFVEIAFVEIWSRLIYIWPAAGRGLRPLLTQLATPILASRRGLGNESGPDIR
jgi:hypothetical protein